MEAHAPSVRRRKQRGGARTDYDVAGNSNGASVWNFTVSGWSDCVSKTGERYKLKPESIATFTRIAAGTQAPYICQTRPVPDDDASQWHDMVITEAVAERYRLVSTWVSPDRSTGRYILYDLLTGPGSGR
jgi:hypothetical protein